MFQQHPARFGGDPAHGISVGLEGIRSARAALVDRDVGAAHHAARPVVRHVELVGHDLPERCAGALAEVGFSDEEGRGVVLADDDPRVELAEVGVGIRARALRRAGTARQPAALKLTTRSPDILRKSRRDVPSDRRTASSIAGGMLVKIVMRPPRFPGLFPPSAMSRAARLMAACTR